MYRFRLETLLRRRKQIEELRRTELSKQRIALDRASAALDQVSLHRSSVKEQLKNKLSRPAVMGDLIAFQRYLHLVTGRLNHQKEVVAAARKKMDQKQALLVDAVKRRKTLDRLKEKEAIAYRRRLTQKERDFMNEIAGNRHLRQRRSLKNPN